MRDNYFVPSILILALLYIISPIDLIPDPIPVVGLADDLAVGVEAGAAALAAGRGRNHPGSLTMSQSVHSTRK